MANNPLPTLLTREQVAEWLGVSKRTVITYEELGYIKSVRVGRGVRFVAEELDLNNFPQGRRS